MVLIWVFGPLILKTLVYKVQMICSYNGWTGSSSFFNLTQNCIKLHKSWVFSVSKKSKKKDAKCECSKGYDGSRQKPKYEKNNVTNVASYI